ncbi:integrin beta-1-binding protein 2 isoform X3 [Ranitomeya imitator]|uniref:integrin beta-1-binding protein 2 isoform X3 n=1 Tax=Ranitomeya imitator TaxID=111125 RepID=UPI0037E70C9C
MFAEAPAAAAAARSRITQHTTSAQDQLAPHQPHSPTMVGLSAGGQSNNGSSHQSRSFSMTLSAMWLSTNFHSGMWLSSLLSLSSLWYSIPIPDMMSCPGISLNNTQDIQDHYLLCYNKGCGQRFLPDSNAAVYLLSPDSCLFHPGYPIFHDALKGWSCCRKRTTDFSEFLAIMGCTKGFHSNEKPAEPVKPDISGSKNASDGPGSKSCTEIIVQGPKSAEKMQKERPRTQEQMNPLVLKVSRSLEQELEKLTLQSHKESENKVDTSVTLSGTRCKHSGCKEVYQGPESDIASCVYHPGVPVFHEGMKYWSCCAIKTSDFNEFLEQKGCSTGTHLWVQPPGKQKVTCRYDWHQTSSLVVITVYAKTALPDVTKVLANRTQLDIQITFEGKKEFSKRLELWGVINTENCFVNMLPTKVEITLKKSEAVTWARLELTVAPPQVTDEADPQEPEGAPPVDIGRDSDDDLSWSEDEEPCD